ncbi:indole-diterpene biosynthesis protein-like protein PaxU [Corynespora cassiicola Philippines]|uniref:Indole-diterpene biosynthesis protein-like protein PaxU n=1 Tax=Corynespora cassiicola Philippines TaxID=1448308 RepID=A0A2T2NMR3_CORCC|nr:indole-diterpene biosynthesis protein-like protein PaxU [Corynespora cassiicola Philippines]
MPAPNFVSLGASTSLYTPPTAASGHLVVIATWLGAAEKHIAKYTTAYHELAPKSRILLIQSPVGGLFQTYGAHRRAMRPAVKAIKDVCNDCDEARPHILLHAFSNAGAAAVANLSHVFLEEFKMPLPVVGLICDSSFAKGGYKQNYSSSLSSLPRTFAFKIAGPPISNLMILLQELSIAIGRYERPEEYLRKSILDERLLRVGQPGEEGHKRICYIASKADTMIPWEDVISHAEKARTEGWKVVMFMYDDTPHCNHMAKHEDEYKNTMRAAWTKSKL